MMREFSNHRDRDEFSRTQELEEETIEEEPVQIIYTVGRVCCIKIPRDWKMKNQLIFIFTVIMAVIVSLFVICYVINGTLVQRFVSTSLDEFIMSQFKLEKGIFPSRYYTLVKTQFQKSGASMKTFTRLYQLKDRKITTNEEQLESERRNSFCFISYNSTADKQIYALRNDMMFWLPMTFNDIRLSMNSGQYSVFLRNKTIVPDPPLTFILYPCGENFFNLITTPGILKRFNTTNRAWYTDYMKYYYACQKNETLQHQPHISENYQNFGAQTLTQTISLGLINKYNKLEGILSQDLFYKNQFTKLQKGYGFSSIFLVDGDGLVLSWTNYTDSQTLYFNQTNVTGYTNNAWQQIKRYRENKNYTSDCNSFQKHMTDLCLKNQITFDTDMIFIKSFQPDFILIYVVTITTLMENQLIQDQSFRDQLDKDLKLNIQILGIIVAALILVVLIILHIMFKPLGQIHAYTMQLLFKNSEAHQKRQIKKNTKIDLTKVNPNGTIKRMIRSYLKMTSSFSAQQNRKNGACRYIEEMQFPQKHNKQKIKWVQHLDDLQEYNEKENGDLYKQNRSRQRFKIKDFFLNMTHSQTSSRSQFHDMLNNKLQKTMRQLQDDLFKEDKIVNYKLLNLIEIAFKINRK